MITELLSKHGSGQIQGLTVCYTTSQMHQTIQVNITYLHVHNLHGCMYTYIHHPHQSANRINKPV